jgi:hypothetical protein
VSGSTGVILEMGRPTSCGICSSFNTGREVGGDRHGLLGAPSLVEGGEWGRRVLLGSRSDEFGGVGAEHGSEDRPVREVWCCVPFSLTLGCVPPLQRGR